MGIDGLSKLIATRCPRAVRNGEMKTYFGRRVAIDASCTIYQFLIAMKGYSEGQGTELTNANGEITSHLQGLWSRTLRMLGEGIKPIYVFDGAPPELKSQELAGRRLRAEEAQAQFAAAKEAGDDDVMEKMSKRSVRVSKEQTEDCKKLLRLMGIPVVQAVGEAEAQCVELCRAGKAWAVGTEDMDALTFGAPVMLRHLNYSQGQDKGIIEYHMNDVLEGLGLSQKEFIDLCILLGCDYTNKIPGIGPVKAYEGIKQFGSIEAFIASLDKTKYTIPEGFNYEGARELFVKPAVAPAADIVFDFMLPDEEGLKQFLVTEKLFNEERIEKGIKKLVQVKQQKTQSRLDSFFVISKPAVKPAAVAPAGPQKRGSSASGLPSGKFAKAGNAGGKKGVKK
eukprot:PhM_4_TR4361/c0_g1_i1/m.74056/K04799/FEN1, RAD2; flap endonuclease-1